MANEKLNATLQESILTVLAHDDEHGKIIAQLVDANLFEGDYRVIAEACIDYWQRYGKAPGSHMDDQLSSILDDENNRKAPTFRRILVAMIHLSESVNTKYVLDKLRVFVRMQRFKGAILTSAEQLNRNQEMAIEEIEKLWSGLIKTSEETFDPGTRLGDLDKLLAESTIEADFSTGIPELDQKFVIPARGEVGLFLAAAGLGKSWWLINLGKRALLSRKKVLHISFELSEQQLHRRYYQSLFALRKRGRDDVNTTEFTFNDDDNKNKLTGFQHDIVTPEFGFDSSLIREELEARTVGARYNNLIIKKFPARTMNKRKLEAYLDQLEITEKFIPDMILLDYIGLWETDAKNHRITLGRALEDFISLCYERSIAGETAHQISKAGANAVAAHSSNVAEDWSMIGTADRVIAYSQTPYELQLDLARLYIDKVRTEDAGRFGVLITQNYKIGQFCLESLYLPTTYFNIIDELKKGVSDGEGQGMDEEDEQE